jgi:RimJ/RimL family protein N-acetyltransferase
MIETARLKIVPCEMAHIDALQQSEEALSGLLRVEIAEGWLHFPEVISYVKKTLEEKPDSAPWGMHFFIHKEDNALVGTGGYKGATDAEGMVELGYSIAPGYQRQGLAAEAARGLMEHAFAQPDVRMVDAHTLAEWNPSTKILRKLGMTKIAEKNDPEDGDTWQWRITRAEYS